MTPRGGRDAAGRLLVMEAALKQTREGLLGLGFSQTKEHPEMVKAVPVLVRFSGSLSTYDRSLPPLRCVHCSKPAIAIYSFVEASRRGFGSPFHMGNKVFFQYGHNGLR